MQVKIGDKMFDSKEQPIMVVLSEADKRNIMNMNDDAKKYASFPENFGTPEEMRAWMKIKADEKPSMGE